MYRYFPSKNRKYQTGILHVQHAFIVWLDRLLFESVGRPHRLSRTTSERFGPDQLPRVLETRRAAVYPETQITDYFLQGYLPNPKHLIYYITLYTYRTFIAEKYMYVCTVCTSMNSLNFLRLFTCRLNKVQLIYKYNVLVCTRTYQTTYIHVNYSDSEYRYVDMSSETGIHPNDIVSTLQYMGLLKYWKSQHIVLREEVFYSLHVNLIPVVHENYRVLLFLIQSLLPPPYLHVHVYVFQLQCTSI